MEQATKDVGKPASELLRVRLRALGRAWEGSLLDTPSGREVARALPLELAMRRFLGAFAGRREKPLNLWADPEPRRAPQPGDLAWWPGDSSLCLYLPPARDEDPGRPALPPEVNVIGRLAGDLSPFDRAGHQVRVVLEAAAPLPAERLTSPGYGAEPATTPLAEVRYAPGIYVGPAPDKRGIGRLARRGFASLLDLRTEGEPGQVLSPNVAATWAHAEAVEHLRASISRGVLEPGSVDIFLAQLARAARPVYVYSGTGRRAAALLAIHHALERGLSAQEALEHLRSIGLDPGAHALSRFVQTEVARRSPRPHASPR